MVVIVRIVTLLVVMVEMETLLVFFFSCTPRPDSIRIINK